MQIRMTPLHGRSKKADLGTLCAHLGPVFLWLDDVRPAPEGWVHVKTVEEAKGYLVKGNVQRASLDHDLGDDEAGTGYTLVC